MVKSNSEASVKKAYKYLSYDFEKNKGMKKKKCNIKSPCLVAK
jgi:ribosomal protein S17E|tara:strand:+ start:924 stop:1052 length:129 start_codon:yes stop_codon:yes gene_type:complete